MPPNTIDPELAPSLAKAALDGLDRLLALAPEQDTIPFREISAQVRMIRTICTCGTSAAPMGCRR